MANSHSDSRHSLAEDLKSILEKSKHESLSLGSIFNDLAGRGYPLLAIFFSLPFCQPIQIPGFSTPFGLIIVFVGLRMAFGHTVWWPKWVLEKKISSHMLDVIINKSLWLLQKVQKIFRPRLSWICDDSLIILHGLMTASMGLFLALPLPIPLSNMLAAWAIFLTNLGLLENDGLFVVLGYAVAIMTVLMLVVIVVFSVKLFT